MTLFVILLIVFIALIGWFCVYTIKTRRISARMLESKQTGELESDVSPALRAQIEYLLKEIPPAIDAQLTTDTSQVDVQVRQEKQKVLIELTRKLPGASSQIQRCRFANKLSDPLAAAMFDELPSFTALKRAWTKSNQKNSRLIYEHRGHEACISLWITPTVSWRVIKPWLHESCKLAQTSDFLRNQDDLTIEILTKLILKNYTKVFEIVTSLTNPSETLLTWLVDDLLPPSKSFITQDEERARRSRCYAPLIPWFDHKHRHKLYEKGWLTIFEIYTILSEKDAGKEESWLVYCLYKQSITIAEMRHKPIEYAVRTHAMEQVAKRQDIDVEYCAWLLGKMDKQSAWSQDLFNGVFDTLDFEQMYEQLKTNHATLNEDDLHRLLIWAIDRQVIEDPKKIHQLLVFMHEIHACHGALHRQDFLEKLTLIYYLHQDAEVNTQCTQMIRAAHDNNLRALPWVDDDLEKMRRLYRQFYHSHRDQPTAVLGAPNLTTTLIKLWCELVYDRSPQPLYFIEYIIESINNPDSVWHTNHVLGKILTNHVLERHVKGRIQEDTPHLRAALKMLSLPVDYFESWVPHAIFETIKLVSLNRLEDWITASDALLATYLTSTPPPRVQDATQITNWLCLWAKPNILGILVRYNERAFTAYKTQVTQTIEAIIKRTDAGMGSLSLSHTHATTGALSPVKEEGSISMIEKDTET